MASGMLSKLREAPAERQHLRALRLPQLLKRLQRPSKPEVSGHDHSSQELYCFRKSYEAPVELP